MNVVVASPRLTWPESGELAVQGGIASPPDACVREWVLKRNCSITPVQLGGFFLSLCAVSLGIGVFFLVNGAPFVLAFAGLELAIVGVALLCWARHSLDRETLTLWPGVLSVERRVGARTERADFALSLLSVRDPEGPRGMVRLQGAGNVFEVGRFVRPERRMGLADELRRALVQARRPAPQVQD